MQTERRFVGPQDRLSPNDTFQFACGPHVPCFTECCGKLELLLTPYDMLRLTKGLGITSAEFIDVYTTMRARTTHGFPEFLMKMDPETKRCPFVTPQGCSIYADRPGACRIYPLGRAASNHPIDGSRREFYFTVREEHCKGFEQPKSWKISEWLSDQGMAEYNYHNDMLMDLYVLRSRGKSVELTPQHIQMFIMSCYNIEKFRAFIFKSGFLSKFEVDEVELSKISENDAALQEFAFKWLRFALFRQPTLKVKGA